MSLKRDSNPYTRFTKKGTKYLEEEFLFQLDNFPLHKIEIDGYMVSLSSTIHNIETYFPIYAECCELGRMEVNKRIKSVYEAEIARHPTYTEKKLKSFHERCMYQSLAIFNGRKSLTPKSIFLAYQKSRDQELISGPEILYEFRRAGLPEPEDLRKEFDKGLEIQSRRDPDRPPYYICSPH